MIKKQKWGNQTSPLTHVSLKVAAVIPAFNEETSVGEVVKAIKGVKEIKEIMVVDDGSTDQTAVRAKNAGAEVLSLGINQGKGEAMRRGVIATDPDIVVFADADLLNLQPHHIQKLLMPILLGQCSMTTGTIERGKRINRINHHLEAPFSGLRVVHRELWEAVPQRFKKNYLAESGLYWAARKSHVKSTNFILPGLLHLTKVEKQGAAKGVLGYLKMWLQIGFSFPYHLLIRFKKRRGTKVV